MRRKRLTPELTRQIIKDLGGVNASARVLGTYSSCVSVWGKTGFPRIYVALLQSKFGSLPSVQETFLEKNYR